MGKDVEGERRLGAGDETEGFGGGEAAVFHALVEEVAEGFEVPGTTRGVNELVVVGGSGLVGKWVWVWIRVRYRVLGGEETDRDGDLTLRIEELAG